MLKREGNYHRWLDVYLAALYAHPTNPLVGDFALRALDLSQRCRRETEVRRAFQFVQDMPLDFEAKQRVPVNTAADSHGAQQAGAANLDVP